MQVIFILLLILSIIAPSYAARIYPSPEVPNVTCNDGIDNDANGLVDAADPNCAISANLSSDGGNGYRGNFKDAIITGYTTVADSTAGSGTYLKKTSNIAGYRVGRGAFWANFTNATYYVWIRYRCSETKCNIWLSDTELLGDLNNATQGMSLPNKSSFDWIQIRFAGSNIDFQNGVNAAVNNTTFALNGNKGIFFANSDGLELDGIVFDPDSSTTPDCVNTGCTQPTFNYEIFELGAAATPNDCSSTAFINANIMTWQGFDNTNLTATAKILWKNTGNKPFYICVEPNDTDDEIGSTTNDVFSTQEDNVDFRWRPDTVQAFDSNTRMVVGNLQPIYADADWSGSANTRTFTPNFNTTVAKTVTAGVSWKIFITADGGSSITAGNTGLCNLAIRDKDSGTSPTVKHFFGTTSNALLNINEFGRCKWSATTVPGGGDSTAPTVNTTAETNLTSTGATITFNTNEAGNAFVVYGTSTGVYTLTSAISPCTSACIVTLTGLSPGTTYYYRAKVTDAANNTGQSAEDTAATTAISGTHFVGPTALLSANCSDNANRCLPHNVWLASRGAYRNVAAGDTIIMADGEYNCSLCYFIPPSGLSGTITQRITVKALNDGAAWLNLGGARRGVALSNNDYFIFEGFDAGFSSPGGIISIGTSADNNIFRRICAFDADLSDNNAPYGGGGNTGNLFEDVCGFGKGRKIHGVTALTNMTVRRGWFVWQRSTSIGPKISMTNDYNMQNIIGENIIASWRSEMGATTVNQPEGLLGSDGRTNVGGCANAHYYASIAYVRASDPLVSLNGGLLRANNDSDCNTNRDIVTYLEPGSHTNIRTVSLLNGSGFTSTQRFYTNATEIGGTATPTVGSQWVVTNRKTYATVAAANSDSANPFQSSAGNGARVCFKTVDGKLTNEKLWPWPMDARINQAITRSGRTPSDFLRGSGNTVTSEMETIFGTIPAACKN